MVSRRLMRPAELPTAGILRFVLLGVKGLGTPVA